MRLPDVDVRLAVGATLICMDECNNGHPKTPDTWVQQTKGRPIWYCRVCKKENSARHRANASPEYRDRQRASQRRYAQRKYRELREETLRAYGGECAWCSESAEIFLTLDHVASDGAAHRKMVGGTYGTMRWANAQGYPDSLRLLCYNCNCAREHHGDQKVKEVLHATARCRCKTGEDCR